MIYIAATVEELSTWGGLKCFSKPALAAIIDWHDEQEIDQEADAAELRGGWTEYESASELALQPTSGLQPPAPVRPRPA